MPLHVAQPVGLVVPSAPPPLPAGNHPSPPPGRVRRLPSIVAGFGAHIPYQKRRGVPPLWRAPVFIILVVVALTSGGITLINSKHFTGSSARYLRAPGTMLSDDALSADWYGGASGSSNSSGLSRVSRATNHVRALVDELQGLSVSSPAGRSHGGSMVLTPVSDAVSAKQTRLLAIMRELMDMAEADHIARQAKEGAAATAAGVASPVVAAPAVPEALLEVSLSPLAAGPPSAAPAGAADQPRTPEPQPPQPQPLAAATQGGAPAKAMLNLLPQAPPPPPQQQQQITGPPLAASAADNYRTRLALFQQQRLAANAAKAGAAGMTARQTLDFAASRTSVSALHPLQYPLPSGTSAQQQQTLTHQMQVQRWHHQQQYFMPRFEAMRRSPLQLQIIGTPVEVLPAPDHAAVVSSTHALLLGQPAAAPAATPLLVAAAGTAPSPSAAPLPTSVYDAPAFDPVPPTGFDPATGESLALSRPRDADEASARTQFLFGCVNAGREPFKQRGSQPQFITTDRAFLRLHAFWVHHSTRHLRDRPAFTW